MITAKNVSFSISGHKILKNLVYKFQNPGFYGLLGHSGCGKTTFLKLLSRFINPSSGEIVYDRDAYAGYVPQDDIIYSSLSVFDNLLYIYMMTNPAIDERTAGKEVDKLITTMGLIKQRKVKVSKLSGGQRKRVNIGRALLGDPEVLFLDEPTSGLDPKSEKSIMGHLKKLSEKKLIVLTTHIMESIDFFDAVIILGEGSIVFHGPAGEARRFFGVEEFAKIYDILAEKKASEIIDRFRRFTKK